MDGIDGATPYTLAELAAAMAALGGFEPRPLLAVAVSGGPDSLALTLLADRWARQRGGLVWGLTVDHGLRPQSSEEARQVGAWLAARGIPHAILTWEGAKPASGIQATARAARYRLLMAWCREQGCLHLLTAHHREDQAETVLIRRRAGSGTNGLAGMSAVRELRGCRLLRPLLGVSRSRLAGFLLAERQGFLTDPSNRNLRFERARLRGEDRLGDAAAVEAVLAEAAEFAGRRIVHERELDALMARSVSPHPAGFAAIDAAALLNAPADLAESLLARLAMTYGDPGYPPRRERVTRLRSSLAAAPGRARTLGGCRFVSWRGRVLVLRELARAAPPQRLNPGDCLVWDGRFAARLPPDATAPVTLGYLGTERPEGDARRRAAALLPPLTHAILPAFRNDFGLLAVPHVHYRRGGAGPLPTLTFWPNAALSHAGFTVV
jgi:tRNA(Ile)-lysidine synthase